MQSDAPPTVAEDPSAPAVPSRGTVAGAAPPPAAFVAAKPPKLVRKTAPRRSRPRLLAAVTATVDAMVATVERGPASLLVTKLGERGVHVTEATLRSGDCRVQLERVWVRRKATVRSFGPTGGHDLRPVAELVEHVIDLKWRIGRARADMRGEAFERGEGAGGDPRSHAARAAQRGHVARRVALIGALLPGMAAAGVFPDFRTVSDALGVAGEQLTARTLRRNPTYRRAILSFLKIEPPLEADDHERVGLSRKSSEELGAMIFALLPELAALEAEFAARLAANDGDPLPR